MRRVAVMGLALALAGCGAPEVPRIGFHGLESLNAATRAGRPVGGLACAPSARPRAWAHVEVFARGQTVLLPPGIGIAPPRRAEGAYVRGGRCRYPLWTDEPTGLVAVGRPGLTLGDLFRVWGRPLGRDGAAGFRGRVLVHVDGRRHDGDPAAVALRPHAQVVVQVGGPRVTPHAAYTFPEGR